MTSKISGWRLNKCSRAFGVVDIHTASNGEDAVKKCETGRYDIILCDYNLGEKKNGQQILEELRFKETIKYDTIFVIISAETAKDMVMGALEYLPDGYITKPINKELLQKRLDTLLEQRDEQGEVIKALDKKTGQRSLICAGRKSPRSLDTAPGVFEPKPLPTT